MSFNWTDILAGLPTGAGGVVISPAVQSEIKKYFRKMWGGSWGTQGGSLSYESPYAGQYQNILNQLAQIAQGQSPYFNLDISGALVPIQGAVSAQTQALSSAAAQNLASRGLGQTGLSGAVARDIGIAGQAQLGRAAAQLRTERENALRQAILAALQGQASIYNALAQQGLSRAELEFMQRRWAEELEQRQQEMILNAISNLIGGGAGLLLGGGGG